MSIITIEKAKKSYKDQVVLDSVDLSFEKGKIHGIVGRNGSGKTVLFKSICGFISLDSGKITVANKQVGKDIDIPESVGIIIEAPGFLPNYSGLKNLRLLAEINGKASIERIHDVIKLVGLDPLDKKRVGKYSMGMRQRLGIAQAIMDDPEILILDEPFNGLDISGVDEMRKLLLSLRETGKTVLMSSHSQEDIQLLSDTVTFMDRGRIVSSTTSAACSVK